MRFFFKRHRRLTLFLLLCLLVVWWFSLPNPLFRDPMSFILEDKDGNLLGATIAGDGQWRFPYSEDIPDKMVACITEFEDRRFFNHPGIDPKGIARAIVQNIKHKKIVSGASTISMQVIRLATKAKNRNVFQKLLEMFVALRLEVRYSKKEILAYYLSNAPFGGNTVGFETASWRYYGKKPKLLTWAECATLAVLPNSPGLIHPGRNRKALKAKRNRLLKRLYEKGSFDKTTYELALEESLPEKPLPLPRIAPHLMNRAKSKYFYRKKQPLARVKTTIDKHLQERVNTILKRHQRRLSQNGIHNIAAIVLEVKTGAVLAYVGNVIGAGKDHSEEVDVIHARRSTGSILKPFLYALALQKGTILPHSLLPDIPTSLSGYHPKNYYEKYDGAIPADRALIRSLNIPFVILLSKFGLSNFLFHLQKLGMETIDKPADYYGLPLVLGGAESNLWDISNAYASMARVVNNFQPNSGTYDPHDFDKPHYLLHPPRKEKTSRSSQPTEISASAAYLTFNTIQHLERPGQEGRWERFRSGRQIAWKTGTSFGFRDAWAIGTTPQYVVGVWAGNADGEGRPGLIGVKAAAPVLFDIYDILPATSWFSPPLDELTPVVVCKKSGYLALDICEKDTIYAPPSGKNAPTCPYHQIVHLSKNKKWQVTDKCMHPSEMIHQPWFVLPPVEEFYFKRNNPDYQILPPFKVGCQDASLGKKVMQLIYPKRPTKIYVPTNLDGSTSKTIFKIAHRHPETTVFWYLDNRYLGSTTQFHSIELNPKKGRHRLVVVDKAGNRLEQKFEILIKE